MGFNVQSITSSIPKATQAVTKIYTEKQIGKAKKRAKTTEKEITKAGGITERYLIQYETPLKVIGVAIVVILIGGLVLGRIRKNGS